MKRIISLFFVLACLVGIVRGVPAYPGLIDVKQPDGSVLSVYLCGDENFSYTTSPDGFLLQKNSIGVFEYATVIADEIVLSGVKANKINNRTVQELRFLESANRNIPVAKQLDVVRKKAQSERPPQRIVSTFPRTGSPKSIVILVNFTDCKFSVPNAKQAFSDLLNKSGYNANGGTGSARDYFIASSDSIFSPDFVVVGPFDLPHNMAYYGAPKGGSNDSDPQQMIIDACAAANQEVDFSEYVSNNNRNTVDNVFVYYAGYNQAEGGDDNTIWPHRSNMTGKTGVTFDGVDINDYACTSEFRSGSGKVMCGIGTFSHEFGHVLGLPDWYNTRKEENGSRHATLGTWDIMDDGSYNNRGCTPPSYSAYERFYLGWITPRQLINPERVSLSSIIDGGEALLVAASTHNLHGESPDPTEFFMIENRQRKGWDAPSGCLPGTGLLVERVNYNAGNWNNNTPNNDPQRMGVEIVRADGTTSGLAGDTYPGSENVINCYFSLRNGTQIETPLSNIKEEGNGIISFLFAGGSEDDPFIEAVNRLEKFVALARDTTDVQTLHLKGRKLGADINISSEGSRAGKPFRFRKSGTDGPFTDKLLIEIESDSSFNVVLDVVAIPTYTSYNTDITDYILATCEDDDYGFPFRMPVIWQSPRVVSVVPPVAYEAENVSPYSFAASWSSVFDATLYYMSMYSISDEPGELIENFNSFRDSVPADWKATFNTVNTSISASGSSVLFQKDTDTLETETYFMPASGASLWLRKYNSSGLFTIEGYDGSEWKTISEIQINPSFLDRVVSLSSESLSEADSIVKFRFYYQPDVTSTDGSKGLLMDDFTFKSSKKLTYVYKHRTFIGNADTLVMVSNLQPASEYYYKVKASDKDLQGNKYDNVTDYSNIIHVETLVGNDAGDKILSMSPAADGSHYIVYVPEVFEDYYVYIYTINGALVGSVPVTSNAVDLPRLQKNQIYIVKYSSKDGIKRKDKFAKFFNDL